LAPLSIPGAADSSDPPTLSGRLFALPFAVLHGLATSPVGSLLMWKLCYLYVDFSSPFWRRVPRSFCLAPHPSFPSNPRLLLIPFLPAQQGFFGIEPGCCSPPTPNFAKHQLLFFLLIFPEICVLHDLEKLFGGIFLDFYLLLYPSCSAGFVAEYMRFSRFEGPSPVAFFFARVAVLTSISFIVNALLRGIKGTSLIFRVHFLEMVIRSGYFFFPPAYAAFFS